MSVRAIPPDIVCFGTPQLLVRTVFCPGNRDCPVGDRLQQPIMMEAAAAFHRQSAAAYWCLQAAGYGGNPLVREWDLHVTP